MSEVVLFLTLEKNEQSTDPSQASNVPLISPPPPSSQLQERMVGEEEQLGGAAQAPCLFSCGSCPSTCRDAYTPRH